MSRKTFLQRAGEGMVNALGGVRGRQNLAAWAVAGTAAYFLWLRPEWKAREEREARALLRREEDLMRYTEKVRPRPDPQDTGLIKGKPRPPSSTEA